MSDPWISPSVQSALDQVIGETGTTLAGIEETPDGLVYRRWGVVQAVHTGSRTTVDVTLDGVLIPGIAVSTSYDPVVGDTCFMDLVGTDAVVMGTVGLTDAAAIAATGATPGTGGALDPATGLPIDTSTPAAPVVTLSTGFRMVLASWPPVLTAAGNEVASYTAQISTDSTFSSAGVVQTIVSPGTVVSFDNLNANTVYYVQVTANSYIGVYGGGSLIQTTTTPQVIPADIGVDSLPASVLQNYTVSALQIANAAITTAAIGNGAVTTVTIAGGAITAGTIQAGAVGAVAIAANTITAAQIAANTITAGSAIIGNAAIGSAQIASLSAGSITSGTINAQTITLGAQYGTAALQSSNYSSGYSGWAINGDGTAEFSNVIVRGTVESSTISGSSISGGTISGGTISGGSISIGSNFSVNASGNLTATNAAVYAQVISSNSGNYYSPGLEIQLVGYNTQVLMRLTGSSGSGNTSLVFPYGIPVLTGMYEAGVYGGSGQLGVFSSLSKYKTNIRSLDEQGAAGGANPLWALTPRRFRYTDEVTPKAIHEHPVGYDLDPRDEDPDFYGDDRIEPIEEYGLIAEEVHAVDPVLIVGDITSDVAVWSTHQLVALLVQGVQDLRAAHNDLVNTVGPGAEHALL